MKLLAVVFFALISACSLSQPLALADHGKISGVVIDSTNNAAVEFANVALLDEVSKKPVNGNMCDDKGKFEIVKIPVGTYFISVSFIGYNTKKIRVQVTDKNHDIDLGNITLSPSVTVLKGIEVVGQKQLVEEKVDRLVYNAESDATAKGGDATDVLRRVPLLTVDLDGNVSLRLQLKPACGKTKHPNKNGDEQRIERKLYHIKGSIVVAFMDIKKFHDRPLHKHSGKN